MIQAKRDRHLPRPRSDGSCGRSRSSCTKPLGQRMDACTGPWRPQGQRRHLCCAAKEIPIRLAAIRVWRPCSVSTVIGRADGIAITLRAAQTKSDRRRQVWHHILQQPQLRRIAIFQKYFLPSIMIEIRQRKGPSILHEIESHHAPRHRKTFRRDCSRKRHSARIRSRCGRRGSVR